MSTAIGGSSPLPLSPPHVNGLSGPKKIDRSQVDPQIRQAAEGMEGMFLDYMMQVMRHTIPKSDMDLESPATEIYRGMMDSETAQRAVHAGGVGLADQIIAYLDTQRYNQTQSPQIRALAPSDYGSSDPKMKPPAAKVAKVESTGGTDEGRPNR